MTYADPSRCPGCRERLPHEVTRCPHCDLVVRHPLAQRLFATLTHADELLVQLRSASMVAAPQPLSPPQATSPPQAPPPPPGAPAVARAPRPQPPAPTWQWGLDSVPKILLALGALCLLVASVIFLAVSWSWLGVGGRTMVLLTLTVAAGVGAGVLLRTGLRIAAEALAALGLGLAALDVAGAHSAGWLGDLSGDGLLIAAGVVVTALGSAFAALTRPHLLTPQVAAGLGALATYAGILATTSHDLLAGHLVLAAVTGTLAAAHLLELRVQVWSLAAVAALAWLVTLGAALAGAAGDPTLRALWISDGPGWSLLVSTAALAAVPLALGLRTDLGAWCTAGATLIATVAIAAPAVDESARTVAAVMVLVTGLWVVTAALLPRLLRPAALLPAWAGGSVLFGLAVVTATVAAVRWAELGEPLSRGVGVRFAGPDPVTEPLVAVPAAALLVGLVAASRVLPVPGPRWLEVGVPVTAAAALVTLASYDVPLAWLSTAGALLTLAALAAAFVSPGVDSRAGHGVLALAFATAGCLVALPSATLTAAASGVALAVAAGLHLRAGDRRVATAAGSLVAPAMALALWSGATALAVDPARAGVPVIVAVGLLAILRPRPEVEVSAIAAAGAAMVAAVAHASDLGASLALHLTVAGALVVTTGLVHPTRRHARWVGSALLFVATWVRLADLGVQTPEAYTLPLALALVAVGGWRLRHDAGAGTMLALAPGLGLATVPSLLWTLEDPVSLRALALGVGCTSLAIGGAALRWSAPLLVGAAVGGVLVVHELAPYAGTLPQWVWIGLAGTLLTVVGVTWERRLGELRAVAGHVGRLR